MTKEERISYWRGIIGKHAASDLSAAAFCRERDINISQFHWWRRRFKREQPKCKGTGFLELVSCSKSQHSGIRIYLSDRIFIEVDRGFDPFTLRSVLEAVSRGETIPCLP